MLRAYALHPDAFTSSVAERSALPASWWESRLRDGEGAPEVVFGAFSSTGDLAGVAGVSFERREKTLHKSTLFGMFVLPEHRGRSVGARLVEEVVGYARTRPTVRIMQLTVTDGNDSAVRLYERCGFRTFGVEPFAVQVGDSFISKVHMWRLVADTIRAGVPLPTQP